MQKEGWVWVELGSRFDRKVGSHWTLVQIEGQIYIELGSRSDRKVGSHWTFNTSTEGRVGLH